MNPSNCFHNLLRSAAALVAANLAAAQQPTLTIDPPAPISMTAPFQVVVHGVPGDVPVILFDTELTTFQAPFGTLSIIPRRSNLRLLAPIGQNGESRSSCQPNRCDFALSRLVFYVQGVTFEKAFTKLRGISDVIAVDAVTGDECPPCAEDAATDSNVWAGAPHVEAFWIPGCPDARYSFDEPGTFAEYVDGTARLTGEIRQNNDDDKRFEVDLLFSGRESLASNSGVFPPPGSPKLTGVLPSALAENGGPIDTSEWHYYTAISGQLVGEKDWQGLVYDVTLRGPAAQVGFGASLKNTEYGLSAWLNLERVSGNACQGSIDGDVNIILTDDCDDD